MLHLHVRISGDACNYRGVWGRDDANIRKRMRLCLHPTLEPLFGHLFNRLDNTRPDTHEEEETQLSGKAFSNLLALHSRRFLPQRVLPFAHLAGGDARGSADFPSRLGSRRNRACAIHITKWPSFQTNNKTV